MPKVDFARLGEAIYRSRHATKYQRQIHRRAVEEYVGSNYSENGSDRDVPVPLLSFYIGVMTRHLVAKNPKVMLSTLNRSDKPVVSAMQQWVNKILKTIDYAGSARQVVMNALFSIGIAKVALTTPMDSAKTGWRDQAGVVGIWSVGPEDFVFDMHARNLREAAFMGHRYRVPLEAVRENKDFTSARKSVTASTDPTTNPEGDQKTSSIGRTDYESNTTEFEDMADLWEIYLPRHKAIVTYDANAITEYGFPTEPIGYQTWVGPECGPYHFLGFGWVPDNAMPKAPIQDLLLLHESVNRLYRKFMRQADRQKEVGVITGSADEDGKRIVQANDGDIIRVNDPRNIQVMRFGGADQTTYAIAEQLRAVFNEIGGNLALLGGISAQSDTAAQDKMLNANAGSGVADKQGEVMSFVESTINALCWYWHHDPFNVMRVSHSVPGAPEISITRQVTPEQRAETSWEDLSIKIDPYSMQYETPTQRTQMLNGIMQSIVLPLLPVLQQQGISVDLNRYLQILAEYNVPDLVDVITINEPSPVKGGSNGPQPGQPIGERTYVHESRPGRTQQGDTMNRINTLMGVNPGGNPETSKK